MKGARIQTSKKTWCTSDRRCGEERSRKGCGWRAEEAQMDTVAVKAGEGMTEMTFGHPREEGEGASRADIWGKNEYS